MEFLLRPVSLFLILCLGYLFKRIRLFGEFDYQIVAKIVLNVTSPAVIIRALGSFEGDRSLFMVVPLGFVCAGLPLMLLYFATRGQQKERRVFAMINGSGYNVGNFALPLAQEFLTATGLVTLFLFDMGNALVVSGGAYVLTASLLHTDGEKKGGVKLFLKKLFSSPPIDAYLIMFLLVALGIRLPDAVGYFLEPLASANSFLAMFMIGMMLKLDIRWGATADALLMVGLRLLYGLSFAALFFFCTPFSFEVRRTLAILPLSPIGSLAPVYTERCHGSGGLSSFANSLSILLSFFLILGVLFVTDGMGP